ncbi:unnamed protein product [Lactuca saligna]|uniref:Uncharacterized protein n=1 Tax=Lactuca saligna TaxID=75948 RepID=A0AA36DZM2_LACSI|nr:unnamed protein product [Lactuca saligna]
MEYAFGENGPIPSSILSLRSATMLDGLLRGSRFTSKWFTNVTQPNERHHRYEFIKIPTLGKLHKGQIAKGVAAALAIYFATQRDVIDDCCSLNCLAMMASRRLLLAIVIKT